MYRLLYARGYTSEAVPSPPFRLAWQEAVRPSSRGEAATPFSRGSGCSFSLPSPGASSLHPVLYRSSPHTRPSRGRRRRSNRAARRADPFHYMSPRRNPRTIEIIRQFAGSDGVVRAVQQVGPSP